MKLLIDTYVLFWWVVSPDQISAKARDLIDNADEVFVSAASAWEIATKVRIGKWEDARVLIENFSDHLSTVGFRALPISAEHARHAGLAVVDHKDPFDRLIAAQALLEGLTLISADPKLPHLGAPIIW